MPNRPVLSPLWPTRAKLRCSIWPPCPPAQAKPSPPQVIMELHQPTRSHSKPALPFQQGCCLELMPKTLSSNACAWPGVDEKQGNRPSKTEPEKQRPRDWVSSSLHQLKSKCNYFVSITAAGVHFCLRETERNENMPFPLWHCEDQRHEGFEFTLALKCLIVETDGECACRERPHMPSAGTHRVPIPVHQDSIQLQ